MAKLLGATNTLGEAAIEGTHDGGEIGVQGSSTDSTTTLSAPSGSRAIGVLGMSKDGHGVVGVAQDKGYAAVKGQHDSDGTGVSGVSAGSIFGTTGSGVSGSCDTGIGVEGRTDSGIGVQGLSTDSSTTLSAPRIRSIGVLGMSKGGCGVMGVAQDKGYAAVNGQHDSDGTGVRGVSSGAGPMHGTGVYGRCDKGIGVEGITYTGMFGINGEAKRTDDDPANSSILHSAGVRGLGPVGVMAIGSDTNGVGIQAWAGMGAKARAGQFIGTVDMWDLDVSNSVSIGEGVHLTAQQSTIQHGLLTFKSNIGVIFQPAVSFEDAVEMKKDLTVRGDILLPGADIAEEFDLSVACEIHPGFVMVVGDDGSLEPCSSAYDNRVAGVASNGGNFRHGIVLDRNPAQGPRVSIALVGKVYCWVDANLAPVSVGDLLTTSPTLGHAMRGGDRDKVLGCVLGKALRPLAEGKGLIPVLVTLQ